MKMFSRLLAAALLVSSTALAQTPAQVLSDINTQLPDNSAGAITPAKLRGVLTEIVNSFIVVGSRALTLNHILVGDASNLEADVPISGDCTIVAAGTMTCTKLSGSAGSSGNIVTSNGVALSPVAMSGDCTVTATGVITCTRLSGSSGPAGAILISNGTVFQATSAIGDCNIAFGGTITCTRTGGTLFGSAATLVAGASGNLIQSNGTSFSSVTIASALSSLGTTAGTILQADGATWSATASPSFAAGATAVTATASDNDTSLATTAFVQAQKASPVFTGVPAAPTAAVDTNTTQLSTTAFVVGQAGSALPLIDGTATVGTSLRYARQDHIHPTDTTRAPTASPTFTGTATFSGPVLFTSSTKTTSYAAVSSDCGTTIFAGGTAFFPITVNAASGYTDNCQIKITNTDNIPGTWRAKRVNITLSDGSTTRLLAPGQTIAYQKQGSANIWSVAIEPGRWRPISSPTFYINVSGSDTNDGLASDTGSAFASIYGALGAWKPLLDCGRGGPLFQIANNQTHVITASPQEAYAWVGGCNITIQGAAGVDDRSTYIVQCTSGGTCLNFKENTVVAILNGMRLTCLTDCTGVFSQQGVILDINNMEFGGMGTGSMITCDVQSRCGIFAAVITSGAGNFVVCSVQSFCEFTGSHTYSTPPPAYGFTSANVFAQWSSVVMAGGGYAIGGGVGVTGVRYQALWNSIINLGPGVADTLPGNAAGVTGGTPTHGTDSSMVF